MLFEQTDENEVIPQQQLKQLVKLIYYSDITTKSFIIEQILFNLQLLICDDSLI